CYIPLCHLPFQVYERDFEQALIDEAGRAAIPSLADHATTVVGQGITLWIAIQALPSLKQSTAKHALIHCVITWTRKFIIAKQVRRQRNIYNALWATARASPTRTRRMRAWKRVRVKQSRQ